MRSSRPASSRAPGGLGLGAVVLTLLAPALIGCRQDMHDQAKYEPLEASVLFDDGAASRPLIEGTVARGMLRADDRIYRGLDSDGSFVAEIPVPVTAALLARGRQRYDIYCSPCHDRAGDGQGMIVRRGFKRPQPFHSERLRQVQDGYFFDVISNGFGQMSSYAPQIRPQDRWAVVAYVRALQLSRHAPADRLTAADRERLSSRAEPAAAEAAEVTH